MHNKNAFNYTTTSGLNITATSGKTTTFAGKYNNDMKYIIQRVSTFDDSFRTQLDTLYDNLTSDADKRQNNWEFFKSISGFFIEAFIVGAVVALAVVMLPGVVVAGGIVILAVGCVAMTAVPEEKVPSWLQGSRDIGN